MVFISSIGFSISIFYSSTFFFRIRRPVADVNSLKKFVEKSSYIDETEKHAKIKESNMEKRTFYKEEIYKKGKYHRIFRTGVTIKNSR